MDAPRSGNAHFRARSSVKKRLVVPPGSYVNPKKIKKNQTPWRSLHLIVDALPAPNTPENATIRITDPNYTHISLPLTDLKDHFYDTGLYECEWRQSRFYKTNHPYMGRMAFPENRDNPSRTVTATKIGTSREALIYRSEYNRTGNGEYRTPTVREAACIMGFPITYQFLGGESSKWRLVGNAVCPCVARAFAAQVREFMQLFSPPHSDTHCPDRNKTSRQRSEHLSGKTIHRSAPAKQRLPFQTASL